MSNAAGALRASEAVARFVTESHSGAEFDGAVQSARDCLTAAHAALHTTTEASELASRALAGSAAPPRRAYAAATALAADRDARADAPIVAAALVSAELGERSEADVAEAIAVGREVAARLEHALTLDAPWDAHAVVAGIGATAAAARALMLDTDAARNAIGLAATQAAGLGVLEDTPAAAIAHGKAAADAVEAVLLAKHGFTAASASLEGRRGLAALMASHFDEPALREGLGRRWISAGR